MFIPVTKGFRGVCILMLALTAAASQAADFPSRDIRVIVPWGAGGGTDAIVRKITSIAEKSFPVSMYVENIEGGMSATGLFQLMNERPDGYTLGALTYDSIVTIPWYEMLPGYSLDKLELVARITSEPDAVIVPGGSKYKSFQELIEAAKAAPGTIRVGLQNRGSRTHLTLLRLQEKTGAEFKVITYPGGAAPQKEALLNGEVDFVVTSLGDFAQLINSEQARGLVEFTDKQSQAYPSVPPASDMGLDLQMGSFVVFAVPAETPEERVETLESAYHKAFESDEFQQWLPKVGVTPAWLGNDDVDKWAQDNQQRLFSIMDNLEEQGLIEK